MVPKLLSLLLFGVGIFVLIQVVMPLVSFKIWELTAYNQNTALVSPNSGGQGILGISVQNLDSTFPSFVSTKKRSMPSLYQEFTLSIPAIKLENARVVVDVNDVEQNLALLPGTALPGEVGNVFISGHSSLPQFYRPGNYKAIFANLTQVKRSDKITLQVGGQEFNYQVIGLKIVNPKETWVINPPDNEGRYLTLMTCVPPGLLTNRLIVLAKLI